MINKETSLEKLNFCSKIIACLQIPSSFFKSWVFPYAQVHVLDAHFGQKIYKKGAQVPGEQVVWDTQVCLL